MSESEHHIQVKAINYLRLVFPTLLIYAIPNGGKRDIATAVKLKAEGVLPGIPDLHIPIKTIGEYNSLYIEVKTKKGRLTQLQMDMHKRLTAYGHLVKVCYSWVEIVLTVAVNYYPDQYLELQKRLRNHD